MIEEEKEEEQQSAEESALNKDITVKTLLAFALPTVLSYILMFAINLIDGIFASRGLGVEALSATKIAAPFLTFSMAIGFMLSLGGCALVAKKKGKKLKQEARENFTLLTLVAFTTSMIIAIGGWFLRRPLLRMLGADEYIFDSSLEYIQPIVLMMPFIMIGLFLVQFLIAEGRPMLGMLASVLGAVVSASLNALFIFVFDMGLFGLALATGLGYLMPAIIGLGYFTFNRKGTIYFVRPKWDIGVIGRSSLNGVSELITTMAMTVTAIVLNNVMMRIVGYEGVAAAGIVVALMSMFMALYYGYSVGVAPLISYNFGKQRHDRTQKIFKYSLVIIAFLAVISIALAQIFASLLVQIYVPAGTEMHAMTVKGFRIATAGLLFVGFNIFGTSMFTAFNDGIVSGFMSLMQTLVFTVSLLLLLPLAFGLTGAWLAIPIAELLAIGVTIFFLFKMGRKYKYISQKADTIV